MAFVQQLMASSRSGARGSSESIASAEHASGEQPAPQVAAGMLSSLERWLKAVGERK